MMRWFIVPLLLIATSALSHDSSEIFRIRIENAVDGRIQVSTDNGRLFSTVGRVKRPAVNAYRGFAASSYTPMGAVAATAVHGHRLKVGLQGGDEKKPMTISIVPSQFDRIPAGYGGHIPYGSGIYTDIPAGRSIFRTLAPFVGNAVQLEKNDELLSLPSNYSPQEGDILVIIVKVPAPYLDKLQFENKTGGAVTAIYDDGSKLKIGVVTKPVKGVGRFDGASYTGVGLINTNHGGVITVSTSPISDSSLFEGTGPERRGGFQIQPSEHAKTQIPMPQAMTVAPVKGDPPLEGRAPLFNGYIGLAYNPAKPDESLRVEVKSGGGEWKPMPSLVGKLDDALSSRGITNIRFVFPKYNAKSLAQEVSAESRNAIEPGARRLQGAVTLRPEKSLADGLMVTYSLDGRVIATTNVPPYEYRWTPTAETTGERTLEIAAIDMDGEIVSAEKHTVIVTK